MKDGYYLSTYIHIDELSHLLEFRIRHDQNLSLWKKEKNNIKLIHYWELERVTGLKKHNRSFFNKKHAVKIINKLLKQYNLEYNDLIDVWGTPQLQKNDDYHSLKEIPDLSYHSISHLFSTILSDSELFYNNNILGIAVDGGPDGVLDIDIWKKKFYSGCYSEKGKIKYFSVYSPGFLWTFSRKMFSLEEGSLMALASASKSKLLKPYTDRIIKIEKSEDLKNAYNFVNKLVEYVKNLSNKDKGKIFNFFDPKFSIKENKISIVMKEIQKMSIQIMDYNIKKVLTEFKINTKKTYLALSGGYALNCPTNSYLMNKYNFKNFIAPPCVSDTGISLGIALYAFYKNLKKINFKLSHAFYGDCDEISRYNIQSNSDYNIYIKKISKFNKNIIINDIKKNPIVWFDSKAEIGPRALGHRSILADPRKKKSKNKLNKIKKREWWRPVAPIMLEENLNEWFEDCFSSPFMLHTFILKKEKVKRVPAIIHFNNSARVQTIKKNEEDLLYSLLCEFKNITNIPILCNTSLNDKGEPIINKIPEVINFALRKKIKIIYINGIRIKLYNHNKYNNHKPSGRNIDFNYFKDDEEKNQLLKQFNPYNVKKEILIFYYLRPEIKLKFNLNNELDIKKLTIYATLAYKKLGLVATPGV